MAPADGMISKQVSEGLAFMAKISKLRRNWRGPPKHKTGLGSML